MVKRINNFVKKENNYKIKIVEPIKNKKYRIILALGRFHENKAFEILIEALLKLENHFLWLLGGGELKADYIKLAKAIGVEKRIKIIDWSENISEYYNNADVLVCPSRVEPLGNIIIEGWCHKIPVVASNIMGPKKLIKHKVNGMKFELENIDELVKCLKELDSNNVLKRKMINNAYKDYQNHFSERKVINDFKNFFWKIKNKCAE
jgi:glycosyltransferase involved in cell wall biosynthesis